MKGSMQDNAGVIWYPPLIYLVPLLAGLILHWAVPVTFLPDMMRFFLGIPPIGIGFFLVTCARRTMERAGTKTSPSEPTTTIVVDGPYRFTRNPMYLSLALLYLGIAVSFNALWATLLLPVALLVIQFGVIRREERYLERKFGDKYLRYKARVRRWI